MSKLFSCSGLVLAVILSACSSGGGVGDAVDAQTPDSAGDEGPADAEADGAASAVQDENTAEEPATSDEPHAEDEPESSGEPATTAGTVIGGEETGLTLKIPDEWVDLQMDADEVSEAVGSRDLTDDQAALIESWMVVLRNQDEAVMAIDLNTMTASAATIINAYCAPNDGRIGRQDPAATPTPLRKNDLEEMVELAIWDTFGDGAEGIEVESTTVDGYPAAEGSYTLDMPAWVGGGLAEVAGVGAEYMFLADDDICWVTFTGADESSFGLFDDIAATIDVL